jgi:hypothetical protein
MAIKRKILIDASIAFAGSGVRREPARWRIPGGLTRSGGDVESQGRCKLI